MVLVINLVFVLKVALILVMMKKQDLYPSLKLYLTALVNEKNRPKKIKRLNTMFFIDKELNVARLNKNSFYLNSFKSSGFFLILKDSAIWWSALAEILRPRIVKIIKILMHCIHEWQKKAFIKFLT